MSLSAALLMAAAPVDVPPPAVSPLREQPVAAGMVATAVATASVIILRVERVAESDPQKRSWRSVRREAGGLLVEFD